MRKRRIKELDHEGGSDFGNMCIFSYFFLFAEIDECYGFEMWLNSEYR